MSKLNLVGGLVFVILAAGVLPVSAAEPPAYPFAIQRTPVPGAAVTAAKDAVFYTETSAGREETFLAGPMPEGDWPVVLSPDEPLKELKFKKRGDLLSKDEEIVVYCAAKFGEPIVQRGYGGFRKVRPTLCFRDGDGDRAFEQVYKAYVPFIENRADFEDSFTRFFGMSMETEPVNISPVPSAKRRVSPEQGREGVIELRYGGIKAGKGVIVATARRTGDAKATYETVVEFVPPGAGSSVDVSVIHPIVGSPTFNPPPRAAQPSAAAGPDGADAAKQPVPGSIRKRVPVELVVSVQTANAKSLVGTIKSAFADWVWYTRSCNPAKTAEELKRPAQSNSAAMCEIATWREGNSLVSMSPAGANQPLESTTVTTSTDKPR